MNSIRALGAPLEHATVKHLIRDILWQHANGTMHLELKRWSVQGLGMMRYYIGDIGRLHIWEPRLKYDEVSEIHTHSWALRSLIVMGELRNTRFLEHQIASLAEGRRVESHLHALNIGVYMKQRLHCGMQGGLLGTPRIVALQPCVTEFYGEGGTYHQEANEIHLSDPAPGTVTLMERKFDGDEGQADVYWKYGQRWGDAKPRPATEYEVQRVCASTLKRWFK